jgi:release factor glutamine methyltransferase
MPAHWTVRKLIAWAADYLAGYGVESPRLSGELLLARALGRDRLSLYLAMDQPLTPEELAAFKALIQRRREHEPVAYILGGREFWGLEIGVGPGVLVPRPETELLVERGLEALAGSAAPRILDLCTGSGCVALALARELADAEVVAVDCSAQALAAARANARRLGLEARVELRQGDLYDAVAADGGFFDLITANPPYVTEDEWEGLPRQITGYEPRSALVAGPGGLEVAREIITGARAFLRPLGWLMVELGAGQAAEAAAAARAAGVFQSVATVPDLAGVERVLSCQRGDYG